MDMQHVATVEEIKEVNVTMQHQVQFVPTFEMLGTQYYRIIAPVGHPHYHSDMSLEGMRDWKIIH